MAPLVPQENISVLEEFLDTDQSEIESEVEERKSVMQLESSGGDSQVPLTTYENVLISMEFLNTNHGEIECEYCHSGNPKAIEKAEAHQGLEAQPSVNSVENACGDCHPKIVETVVESLHVTLAPFTETLKARAGMEKWKQIDMARQNHCTACHTSCGGCHVSRPAHVWKGFINGHIFQKRPDPINQCMACHGSRVGSEFTGLRGQGDVHTSKHKMGCIACHKAKELHAAAPAGIRSRYDLKEAVHCTDCHNNLEDGSVLNHTVHVGKVQCQVCHSQSYTNCYSCHVGKDDEGIPYFQNRKDVEIFKIGLNPNSSAPGAGYKYMLVRHVPVDPKVFDYYVTNGLVNYSNLPTWKRASPHNIRRRTWQNSECNNCHGNRSLFLDRSDLLDYEIEANKRVIVSNREVPGKIVETQPLKIDSSKIGEDMLVKIGRQQANNKSQDIQRVDARSGAAYESSHIKKAVNIDTKANFDKHRILQKNRS